MERKVIEREVIKREVMEREVIERDVIKGEVKMRIDRGKRKITRKMAMKERSGEEW